MFKCSAIEYHSPFITAVTAFDDDFICDRCSCYLVHPKLPQVNYKDALHIIDRINELIKNGAYDQTSSSGLAALLTLDAGLKERDLIYQNMECTTQNYCSHTNVWTNGGKY